MPVHSLKRQGAEVLAVLLLAGIIVLAVFGFIGYSFLRAADELTGPHLSAWRRTAIDRSDCRQLRSMLPTYQERAGSTAWGVEGADAIVKRAQKLHCEPPLRSPWLDKSN